MPAAPSTVAQQVATLSAEAMACAFAVQFPAARLDRAAAFAAFDTIEAVEERLSAYRETSELSRLTAAAAAGPAAAAPELFALLERCADFHARTEGAFDVAVGPLIRAWGFFARSGQVPAAGELDAARAASGFRHVLLDRAARTVAFARPGVELNLGAVGKGAALDEAAAGLRAAGFREALLSAGHSSLLALDAPPWDVAWHVEVRHPLDPDSCVALVRLRRMGFSTSGVGEQWFADGGRRYGHVLDPRTGVPAEGVLQASALAPDATLAEALSTAFLVNGTAWTERYCRTHPGIGALLVPTPGPGEPARALAFGAMVGAISVPEAA